jgi:hypothetical protein
VAKLNDRKIVSLPHKFQRDMAVVIAAVQQSGYALHYLSKAIRDDRGVVLAVVQQNSSALENASAAMKIDYYLGMATAQQKSLRWSMRLRR